MANSSTVAALDDILAGQYNNLRLDVLDATSGHDHDGTEGKKVNANDLSGTTLASGVTASSLTSVGTLTGLTASEATITAGNLGVNTAIVARRAINVGNPASGADGASTYGLVSEQTYGSTSGTTALIAAGYLNVALTVTAATTVIRRASLYVDSTATTVNGTLTNNNGIYISTPSGGSTVRVIDTAAGGYLTTGGAWTDNPSWEFDRVTGERLKRDVAEIGAAERKALFNWVTIAFRPIRYRPTDHYEDVEQPVYEEQEDQYGRRVQVQVGTRIERVLARYHRDEVDYPHLGYRLEDLPQNIREIVCADISGGISGKDERGLLFLLVGEAGREIAGLHQRIAALEARLN